MAEPDRGTEPTASPPRRDRDAIERLIRQRRATLATIEALERATPGRYRDDVDREHAYLNYLLGEWRAVRTDRSG